MSNTTDNIETQKLRERVAKLEQAVREAAVLADFAETWITDPAIDGMRRLKGKGDRFRELLGGPEDASEGDRPARDERPG